MLNPKVALFFLALLPQFIDADARASRWRSCSSAPGFVVNGTLFLLAFVALAHRARSLGARPSVRRALNLLGASLFAVLAGRLALSSR